MRTGLVALTLVAGCTFVVPASDGTTYVPPTLDAGDGTANDHPVQDPPPPDDMAAPPVDDMAEPAVDMSKPKPPIDMTPPKLKAIGDPCNSDEECGPQRACLDHIGTGSRRIDFPDGYCSKLCSGEKGSCPDDASCQKFSPPVFGSGGVCVADCPPSQCRQGYRCCPSVNQCVPLSTCPN